MSALYNVAHRTAIILTCPLAIVGFVASVAWAWVWVRVGWDTQMNKDVE